MRDTAMLIKHICDGDLCGQMSEEKSIRNLTIKDMQRAFKLFEKKTKEGENI